MAWQGALPALPDADARALLDLAPPAEPLAVAAATADLEDAIEEAVFVDQAAVAADEQARKRPAALRRRSEEAKLVAGPG